ncbi:single-stranded DNA-binding protein [Candidatus Saccharibacteria bacterium]|nr:single-stranded DNA-binding protein [Candidatus Saccharibacteria bacterium]
MRGFSKVILVGNLTRDPETRVTPNGATVVSSAVAVNRAYKDGSGNSVENVSFFDFSAFGKTGETIAKYVKKGDPILISGRLDQRTWEDKNGGGKRSRVEVVVEDFNFMGNGGQSGGSYNGGASANAGANTEVVPDDIPAEAGDIDLSDVPF